MDSRHPDDATGGVTGHAAALERLWVEARRLAALPVDHRAPIDEDGVFDSICSAARTVVAADGACVVLREGELVHYAREDAMAPLWAGQRFPIGNCISGWSIERQERVVIEDIYEDPRIPLDYYASTFVKSLAMQPIDTQQPIGALGVYWSRRYVATNSQLAMLERLADIASLVITNMKLRAALHGGAITAPLQTPSVAAARSAASAKIDGVSLIWKFVPVPKPNQLIYWVWQAWTRSGELHATSAQAHELFSECEADARAHGYVPPDRSF